LAQKQKRGPSIGEMISQFYPEFLKTHDADKASLMTALLINERLALYDEGMVTAEQVAKPEVVEGEEDTRQTEGGQHGQEEDGVKTG
jgi:hypothetical protein